MTPHRSILRRVAALAAVAIVGTALAACSSTASASTGSGAKASYGEITVQLDWLKNHEFAGLFEADAQGYFKKAGFSKVDFLAGGLSGAPAATQLVSGKAQFGLAGPTDFAAANAQGADLRIVAATYQKNPFTIVSADTDPITKPKDLVGKTIAIADSSATNWTAFLTANKIDPSSVNRVPYGDANNDLRLGNIQGFMGYGDGGAPLRAQGFGAQEFYLADFGLNYSAETVAVTDDFLKKNPAEVEAFLTAAAQGWKKAFDGVDGAIDLVINDYGKDQKLTKADTELEWAQQAKLIITDESTKNGIGTISPSLLKSNIDSLHLVGDTKATAANLFDTTLIAKVYKDHPELTGAK